MNQSQVIKWYFGRKKSQIFALSQHSYVVELRGGTGSFLSFSSDHIEIGLIVVRGIRLPCTRAGFWHNIFTIIFDSTQWKQDPAGAISVGALELTGTSHGRNKISVFVILQMLKDCGILDIHLYVLCGILQTEKTEICHPFFSRKGELISTILQSLPWGVLIYLSIIRNEEDGMWH